MVVLVVGCLGICGSDCNGCGGSDGCGCNGCCGQIFHGYGCDDCCGCNGCGVIGDCGVTYLMGCVHRLCRLW